MATDPRVNPEESPFFTLTLIEEEPISTSSPCHSCFAACCREGMVLALTSRELEFMLNSGTQLSPYEAKDKAKPGWRRHFYRLDADCANLDPETNGCEAHEDSGRPKNCRELKAGSFACAKTYKEQSHLRPELVPVAETMTPVDHFLRSLPKD